MRKLIGLLAALAVAAALAVPALAATTKTASVGDFFLRPNMTVTHGTKVVWKWKGGSGIQHTVTVRSGPVKFGSKLMSSGSYSHVFTTKGTYHLYCKIHPTTMKETIVVK